ncbi:unnamed protein product, partial [Nesidiocoris tenuis]
MVHIKSPNYPTQLPSKDMLSLSLRPHQHHLQPVDTPATPSSVEAWIQSISTGEYPPLGSAGIPLGVCWQARKEETNSLVPSPPLLLMLHSYSGPSHGAAALEMISQTNFIERQPTRLGQQRLTFLQICDQWQLRIT